MAMSVVGSFSARGSSAEMAMSVVGSFSAARVDRCQLPASRETFHLHLHRFPASPETFHLHPSVHHHCCSLSSPTCSCRPSLRFFPCQPDPQHPGPALHFT